MPGATHALAQAQHGSAPDIAGKDRANPASLIGSAAMLLAWLGERRGDDGLLRAADLIERALDHVIAQPEWRTADLGGPLGTKAFASASRRRSRNWRAESPASPRHPEEACAPRSLEGRHCAAEPASGRPSRGR